MALWRCGAAQRRGGREGNAGGARYGASGREDASSRIPSQALAHSAGRLSSTASLVSTETNVAAATVTPLASPHTHVLETQGGSAPALAVWALRPSETASF